MLERIEIFEDGMTIRVEEAYIFPYGDVYRGSISVDGRNEFTVSPCTTQTECLVRLEEVIEGEIAKHEQELARLRTMKEKVKDINEQI